MQSGSSLKSERLTHINFATGSHWLHRFTWFESDFCMNCVSYMVTLLTKDNFVNAAASVLMVTGSCNCIIIVYYHFIFRCNNVNCMYKSISK